MADNSLKGPKVVTEWSRFEESMPFGMGEANFFVNGTGVEMETFKSYLNSGYLVIYLQSGGPRRCGPTARAPTGIRTGT